MKKNLYVGGGRWFLLFSMFLFVGMANAVTLPYTFVNNSAYPDDQIYIAVCGNSPINGVDKSVWVDCKTSAVNLKNISDNTIASPGTTTPNYANIFTKLSDIPNKVVVLPEIGSCRIWIGFKSPLYIHFFDTGGNTAPDLNNGSDPNNGIRFEMIELSWGLLNGSPCIWSNTTRVDSYQYPMGLELWGWSDKAKTKPYDKKVGEILHHDEIIAKWKAEAPEAYQGCLDNNGVIKFPTKIASWKPGGQYASIMSPYIDAIWEKYRTDELAFGVQDNGTWRGHVTGDIFLFSRTLSNGTVEEARINGKPSQTNVLEGAGLFNDRTDGNGNVILNNRNLTIQTQMCAAITRHALDLTVPSGVVQDWSDDTKYYTVPLYNWYAAFWHNPAVSYNKLTYAFCYDDVFDKSSTINCPNVERGTVTIGGFASPIGAHYPTATAGANKAIVLPTNSVSLVGTGVDMDGKPLTYQWTQITTGKATIVSPNSAATSITGLGIGSYVFRLTVSNGTLSDFAEVKVQVDPDPNAINLALNKPATASSVRNNGTNVATKANDGDASSTSRWESEWADPQWIKIDLQKVYNVEGIKIIWQNAAAKAYTLEVSLDGLTWKNVFTTSTGSGGTTFASCSETGRYVRMSATSRTTGYGVSILEFQVFGSDPTELTSNQIEKISLYPNPVSDVLRISGVNDNSKVDIYSVQGVKVMEHVGKTVDVSSLNSGIYIARFGNTSLRFTKK